MDKARSYSFGFGWKAMARYKELWPVTGAVAAVCLMSAAALFRTAANAQDVNWRFGKYKDMPRYETPRDRTKLMYPSGPVSQDPELAKLREEIGSYTFSGKNL